MTYDNKPIFHHEDRDGDSINVYDCPLGVVLVFRSDANAVGIRREQVPALIEALTNTLPQPEPEPAGRLCNWCDLPYGHAGPCGPEARPAPHTIAPQGAQLRMSLPGWGGIEKWVARCGACGKPVILEGNKDWVHEEEAGNVS